MSKLKGLKQRFMGKKESKFKAQHVNDADTKADESDDLPSDDEFYVEPPEFGDQFMACKPWLGAIKAPEEVPAINSSPPAESYEIEFVQGYKSDLTR